MARSTLDDSIDLPLQEPVFAENRWFQYDLELETLNAIASSDDVNRFEGNGKVNPELVRLTPYRVESRIN